jgi:transcriptional regulator with XRE-family HTH domain
MTIKSKITQKSLKTLEKIAGKLTLGRMLWAIRESDEISQVDFAKKLNISKQHLCDIEHNRVSVSPKLAAEYADILGYPRSQFIKLSIQDILDRDKLGVSINVIPHKKHGRRHAYACA